MKQLFRLLKHRFLSRNPFFLVFYVTSRCNARCAFCFNWENVTQWRDRSAAELSVEEIGMLTRKLGPIYQLTLAGGEPFMRRELPEIVSLFHRNCAVQTLTIPTNGTMPDRIPMTVERIVRENPHLHVRIGLSTPDIGEKLEEIYQVKNAAAKHAETFRALMDVARRYTNLTISVGITISKFNADHADDIITHIKDHMPGCKPQLALVRGNPEYREAHQITAEQIEGIYRFYDSAFHEDDNRPFAGLINSLGQMVNETTVAMSRGVKPDFLCRSGEKLIVIYDNGDVFPCEYLDDAKMGNVRDFDYNVRRILATDRARNIVKTIRDTHCACTWECANYNNVLFSPRHAIKVVLRFLFGNKGCC